MSVNSQARHRRVNKTRPCSISLCPRLRIGSRSFCRKHSGSASVLGNPSAKELSLPELQPWINEAERLITPFVDHPATVLVIGFLNDLLHGRQKVAEAKAAEYFTALRTAGIEAKAMLYRLCAVALLEHHNPSRFLHSTPYYHYALALSVLKMIPRQKIYARSGAIRYRPIHGTVSKAVAAWVTTNIGVFLLRLIAHLSEHAASQSAQREVIASAFKTTKENHE